MTEENFPQHPNLTELAVRIVAAYVAHNSVQAFDLPNLILNVHNALVGLTSGSFPGAVVRSGEADMPSASQVRKSIQRDGIVSFIDGKPYKTLKRHLTANGFSPQGYRERYGLPADYPMVAPSYAERRSALAKAIGLGQPGGMANREREELKAA